MTDFVQDHTIVSESDWIVARKKLLQKEKQLTRLHDAVTRQRRELPWVKVEKCYVFEGTNGLFTLQDLFEGRRQLIIQHVMFDPSREKGCATCTHFEYNFDQLLHLHAKDTSYAVISRAPQAKIERYKDAMGWTIPWYSSYDSDFNYDFHVTIDESIAPILYNYRNKDENEQAGTPWYNEGEQSGISVFVRDGGCIYHTYSTFARGLESLVSTASFLDLTPLGR